MTFGAPPSKAAQEAEAAARNQALQASGEGPDMNEGNVETIGEDTPPPAPAPAPAETQPEAPAEEKTEPTAPPNPRDEIARRYRERREKERETFIGHEVEPKPLFLNGEKPAEAAPTETVIAPEAKTYELKVFGKSENVTREQLLAMADLTAEDADGLPEKTLIKAAQIAEAAKRKLESAKAHPFGATPAPAAPSATPAETKEPSTTEPETQSTKRGKPTLTEAFEKIQYGDPEEAEAAFVSAVDQSVKTALAHDRQQARMQAINAENDAAINSYAEANPDVTGHPHASRFLLTETTSEIINDLRALGAPEENLSPLYLNPAQAIQAHREARLTGLNVRKPTDILAAAGQTVRTQFGLTKTQPGTSPSNAPVPATNARLEEKRKLTQQPQRSATQVATTPPASLPSRSNTIQRMRAARGQPVA